VIDRFGFEVLRAIELDDELYREADEVDDVWPERGLSSELMVAEFLSAEEMPEAFFGVGGLIAQRTREVALFLVAIHARLFPPSLALPAEGRGPEEKEESHTERRKMEED
jgi:hypothetical protein